MPELAVAELSVTHPDQVVRTALLWIFVIAITAEALAPRRRLGTSLLSRWSNNYALSALSWYAATVIGTYLLVWLASWSGLNQAGLLARAKLPTLLEFAALLIVLQFIGYWMHRAFHKISWLWPLHAVHHSDTDVDVSTTFRHHPLEPLLSLIVAAPVVTALGVSPEAALTYRVADIALQAFNHSNLRLPESLERKLRLVLVTPDFHRTHHNADRRFTDSNYGGLVPWFDYLFGTAAHQPYDAQTDSVLGLEYLRAPEDSRVDRLLTAPIRIWQITRPD